MLSSVFGSEGRPDRVSHFFTDLFPLFMLFFLFPGESGCEADMAEGGAEEENGEMLGPAAAPSHQPPTGLNVKTEVSPRKKLAL